MKNKFHSGFTWVELLVVISVITIITGIIVGYLYEGAVRGRDTHRKENIDQMAKAIDFYFSDNGYLPENQTGWCTYISNSLNGYGAAFQSDLLPYMKHMQFDPIKSGRVGDYLFNNLNNTAGHYAICAQMEQSSASNGNYDYTSCVGGAVYNYCIIQ